MTNRKAIRFTRHRSALTLRNFSEVEQTTDMFWFDIVWLKTCDVIFCNIPLELAGGRELSGDNRVALIGFD